MPITTTSSSWSAIEASSGTYFRVPIFTSEWVTTPSDAPAEQPTEQLAQPVAEPEESNPPILPDRTDDHTGRVELLPYDGHNTTHYGTIWVLEHDILRSINRRIKTHRVVRCYIVHDRHGSSEVGFWDMTRAYERCPACHKFYFCSSRDGEGLCRTCAQTHTRCLGCREFVERRQALRDSDGQYICERCYRSRRMGECSQCGRWAPYDSYYHSHLCHSCQERRHRDTRLQSHTFRPSNGWTFFPKYENDKLYLGVELETDDFLMHCSQASDELQKLKPYKQGKFYNKADGSLNNGVEIVTHPATLDYHRTQMGWEEIYLKVKKLGGKSHYTHTAGLHVHFNEVYLASGEGEPIVVLNRNTLKLLYLTKHFWRYFLRFSRRHPTRLGYCKPYSGKKERFRKMTLSQYERVKKENDRYHTVNLHHPNTIEIRWFRGTLNIQTLYASLELVDFLVNLVKRHSAPYLYRLTWTKLTSLINPVKYPNLEAYMVKKKLKEGVNTATIARED